MRTATRRTAEGLAVAGGAIVVFRPGTRANRAARHQLEALARHLRHFAGRLHAVSYRLRGRHPDPNVSGNVLADRIRSSLGPLEKRLDLPRIHVMVEGQRGRGDRCRHDGRHLAGRGRTDRGGRKVLGHPDGPQERPWCVHGGEHPRGQRDLERVLGAHEQLDELKAAEAEVLLEGAVEGHRHPSRMRVDLGDE